MSSRSDVYLMYGVNCMLNKMVLHYEVQIVPGDSHMFVFIWLNESDPVIAIIISIIII